MRAKVVVLTGAGISAESGISTFRDANGLWENHAIEDVASPEGFARNPELVHQFYNLRRAQLTKVEPNYAHTALAQWENEMDIVIITQNVDDLHERAGSKNVLHLHGELGKVRSTTNPEYIIDWTGDLSSDDYCPKGGKLRPHIVWFGESVPLFDQALSLVQQADSLVVIGTSLNVYPAASLLYELDQAAPLIYLDPYPENIRSHGKRVQTIAAKATEGIDQVYQLLKNALKS